MDNVDFNTTYITISLIFNSLFFIILPVGLYKYYTRRKKVSCWFCSHLQIVNHTDLVCWSCSQCNQYNGFNQDGDYNINNPAFYDESLNPNRYCISQEQLPAGSQVSGKSDERFDNGLCDDCNMKQKMKVRLLNEFTPFNEDNFEHEYQEYSKYIDTLYGLCVRCDSYADSVIRKKNIKYAKVLRFSDEDQFDDGDVLNPDKYRNSNLDSKAYRSRLRQKVTKNSLPFKVWFFESIVVTSSLTLFVFNIYDLDQDCNLKIFSGLQKNYVKHLSDHLKHRLQITVVGLLSSLLATHFSGIHLLSSSDVVSSFFWMLLQILHFDYAPNSLISHVLSRQDLFLLRPIASIMTLLLSVNNIIGRRSLIRCQDKRAELLNAQIRPQAEVSRNQGSDKPLKTAVIKPQQTKDCHRKSTSNSQDCDNELDKVLPPKIDSLKLGSSVRKVNNQDKIDFQCIENNRAMVSQPFMEGNKLALVQPAKFNYCPSFGQPQPFIATNLINNKLVTPNGKYQVRPDQAIRYDAAWGGVVANGQNFSEPSGLVFNKLSSLYLPIERQKMSQNFH